MPPPRRPSAGGEIGALRCGVYFVSRGRLDAPETANVGDHLSLWMRTLRLRQGQ